MIDELEYYRSKFTECEIIYDKIYYITCSICKHRYVIKKIDNDTPNCRCSEKCHQEVLGRKQKQIAVDTLIQKSDTLQIKQHDDTCCLICTKCNWEFSRTYDDILADRIHCLCNPMFPRLVVLQKFLDRAKDFRIGYYNFENGTYKLYCTYYDHIIHNSANDALDWYKYNYKYCHRGIYKEYICIVTYLDCWTHFHRKS